MSDAKIKVITEVCRSSYMFVNKLEEDDNGTKKCKTAILIPKKNKRTIKAIQAAIEAASQKKFHKKAVKGSSKWSYPLRDGDAELESGELEVENPHDYEGMYFLSATAYKIPQLVNNENERVEDFEEREEMCVSGNWFKFSITFKGFEVDGNKGVRALLNNIMYWKEGDRLDGGKKAEEDFDGQGVDDDEQEEEEEEKPSRKSRRKGRRNR